VVGVAQSANPAEVPSVRLVELPAAVVLEPVIMSARGTEIVPGGGPAVGVVVGVVFVGGVGGGPAADHDAGPVAGVQVAA
jgi:hypothetical protein